MSINYLFMVKQVFEGAYSNRPFTLIVEEAMEWKWWEKNKQMRRQQDTTSNLSISR